MTTADRARIGVLDAFRGLAVIAVLLYHFTYRFGPEGPAMEGVDLYGSPLRVDWFSYGWLGVQFFFMISGFVIFMTLTRCRSAGEFGLRRLGRIYPPYVVAMVVTLVLVTLMGVDRFQRTPTEFLVGLTLNSDTVGVRWIDGVYWSLLVELKFYVLIGLAFLVFRGASFIWAWVGLNGLAIAVTFLNPVIADNLLIAEALPFFTAGMGFFLVVEHGRLTRPAALLFAAAAITYVAVDAPRWDVWASLIVLGMVGMFVAFIRGWLGFLSWAPLVFVGTISYSLYLLHENIGVSIIVLANRVPFLAGWLAIVIAMAAVVLLSWALFRWVERPSQAWTRRAVHGWARLPRLLPFKAEVPNPPANTEPEHQPSLAEWPQEQGANPDDRAESVAAPVVGPHTDRS